MAEESRRAPPTARLLGATDLLQQMQHVLHPAQQNSSKEHYCGLRHINTNLTPNSLLLRALNGRSLFGSFSRRLVLA